MRILVAAGGTGGHIYPALAVVTQLSTRRPDVELRWIGGQRGLERDIVPAAGLPLDRLWLRSLRSVDKSINSVLDPVRLAVSLPQALAKLMRWRPDVIYTTGGYVAIPILAAAALLRIPSLLWEGNQIPGRSVRLTARLGSVRTVSFEKTRARLPAPTYALGTPTRHLEGMSAADARARLGIEAELPVVLVFGGSQSVRRLDEAVADAIGDLVERCVVVHVTGPSSFAAAKTLRDGLPPDRQGHYRPFEFLYEDMEAALTAAQLLVGRAGSSTLAEAAAAGLPMIVVPYPHAASHQRANAAEMVEAGAAILVNDSDLDGDTLRDACDLLFDARLGVMSAAARSQGRPGAAAATIALLEALAERRALPEPDELDVQARASR